jgi:hypothetical protein
MQPGREFEAGRILRPCRLRKVTRHPIDGFSIGLSRNRRWDQEWVASGPDTCAGANGDAWDTLGCRREFARPVVVGQQGLVEEQELSLPPAARDGLKLDEPRVDRHCPVGQTIWLEPATWQR